MLSQFHHSTDNPSDTGEIRRIVHAEAERIAAAKTETPPVDRSLIAVVLFWAAAIALIGYLGEQHNTLDLHAKGLLLTASGVAVVLAFGLGAFYLQDRRQARRVESIAVRINSVGSRIDGLTKVAGRALAAVSALAAEQEQMNAFLSRLLTGGGPVRPPAAVDQEIIKLAAALADRKAAGDARPLDEMSDARWRDYMSGYYDGQNRAGEAGEPPVD